MDGGRQGGGAVRAQKAVTGSKAGADTGRSPRHAPAQPRTESNHNGVAVLRQGRLVVAEGSRSGGRRGTTRGGPQGSAGGSGVGGGGDPLSPLTA